MAEAEDAPSPPPLQGGTTISIQNIYFNGVNLGLSNADMNALLLLDGQPVGRLNMSFNTAKALAALINDGLSKLEAGTGQDVLRSDEVAAKLQEFFAKEKEK